MVDGQSRGRSSQLRRGLEARFSPDLKTLYFSADAPASNVQNAADKSVSSRIFQIAFFLGKTRHIHEDADAPN
jgi:hypothetical protein